MRIHKTLKRATTTAAAVLAAATVYLAGTGAHDPAAASLQLPAASSGTQPATYKATVAHTPGVISARAGTYTHGVDTGSDVWTFTATDADQRPTAGTPTVSGDAGNFWFAGDKIVVTVPVVNGPVTVDQTKPLPQLALSFGIDALGQTPKNRTASYVNAGGPDSAPHTGSSLRFEYTVAEGDTAYYSPDLGGNGYLKIGAMSQVAGTTDSSGHALAPRAASDDNLLNDRRIRGDYTRPAFASESYAVTKWQDENLAHQLPSVKSLIQYAQYRLKHASAVLPTVAPESATAAPYGITFTPTSRTMNWNSHPANVASVTLTYEIYLLASHPFVAVETVLDTATVTVTAAERPVPTAIQITAPAEPKAGNSVGVKVTYNTEVQINSGTPAPSVKLNIGNATRNVPLTAQPSGDKKSVTGNYTLVAADQGAISVPAAYLQNGERLVGASDATHTAKRGQPVRPTTAVGTAISNRFVNDVALDDSQGTAVTKDGASYRFYEVGDNIRVIVRHNQEVVFADATPQPTLTLDLDGVSRTAAYNAAASDPAAGKHAFDYTVAAADRTQNGDCAVTGMANAGSIDMTMPTSGRIVLAGCQVDPGAPTFSFTLTVASVAYQRGGYVALPQANLGAGALTYSIAPNPDARSPYKGRADLTLETQDDGSHGARVPGLSNGNNPANYQGEIAQASTLTVTDARNRSADFEFSVRTVNSIPDVKSATAAGTATGSDTTGSFYRIGDVITVTARYMDSYRVRAADGTYLELDLGDETRRAYAVPTPAGVDPTRDLAFTYTVAAGDSDTDGISLASAVIRNCGQLTAEYENQPGQWLRPNQRMYQMADGCPVPAMTGATLRVRTVNGPLDGDLDRDDDGLIDVSTAGQLIMMGYDPNGNGVPGEIADRVNDRVTLNERDVSLYNNGNRAATTVFPNTSGNPSGDNGCPDGQCKGYELLNDIDLNDRTLVSIKPLIANGIGSHELPWQTVLEGNGYRILGLDIGSNDANSVGFLQNIGPKGIVRNLGFVSPHVRGDVSVGVLAGTNAGLISNVFVQDGTVTAASSNAGLITGQNGTGGYNSASHPQRIERFWATGTVTIPDALGAGAAVGTNHGTISEGWTDGWTNANLPVGNDQGQTSITGYGAPGNTVANVREVHSAAASGALAQYLITAAKLNGVTAASPAPYAPGALGAAHWDFGDGCQRPVLSSAGHQADRQAGGQGSACASQ